MAFGCLATVAIPETTRYIHGLSIGGAPAAAKQRTDLCPDNGSRGTSQQETDCSKKNAGSAYDNGGFNDSLRNPFFIVSGHVFSPFMRE